MNHKNNDNNFVAKLIRNLSIPIVLALALPVFVNAQYLGDTNSISSTTATSTTGTSTSTDTQIQTSTTTTPTNQGQSATSTVEQGQSNSIPPQQLPFTTNVQNTPTTTDVTYTRITSQLSNGSRGDEVRILQAFLAEDPAIYPQGIISGYYGPLTQKAVAEFQKNNGIDSVGIVGPKTIENINQILSNGTINIQNIISRLNSSGTPISNIGQTQNSISSGFDVSAPIISNIRVSYINNTGTTTTPNTSINTGSTTTPQNTGNQGQLSPIINWDTNENSTSKIYFGTSYPLVISQAQIITGGTQMTTNHNVTLSNIQMTAKYYYIIESTDSSGNVSWSTQLQLTTQ